MENVDHFSLYFGVLCAPPLSPSPHAHTTPTRRRLCLSTVSDSPCLGDAEVVKMGTGDLVLMMPVMHSVILEKHNL